jgi:hypothetical protein
MERQFMLLPRHLTEEATVELEAALKVNIKDTNWDAFGITLISVSDESEEDK